MSKSVKHLAIINVNDEYGTPPFLFLEACKKFNCTPTVDYFASHTNHVCDKYYTKEDKVFEMDWTSNGFLNPPYSIIKKVMKKAYEEHLKNNIELLILTYNKTDTKWWHSYVEGKAEVHFHNVRISFNDRFGKRTQNKAPYGSAWIIYRAKPTMNVQVQNMFPNYKKYGKLR